MPTLHIYSGTTFARILHRQLYYSVTSGFVYTAELRAVFLFIIMSVISYVSDTVNYISDSINYIADIPLRNAWNEEVEKCRGNVVTGEDGWTWLPHSPFRSIQDFKNSTKYVSENRYTLGSGSSSWYYLVLLLNVL